MSGVWVDKGGRWADLVATGGRRRLDGVVQRGRVLAPEGVSCRRWRIAGLELRGARAGGGSDRYEFLGRTEPVAREPYDVLLIASCPTGVFSWTIARSHGFADLSSVRVPVRHRGEVQYKPVLDPVCLN